MITLTTEQAQQIEEVLMMLAEKRMDLGLFLKAIESIRAARAQGECATLDAHWVSEEELPSFNAWLSLFVESRIMEDRAARAQEQPHPDDEAVDRFAAAMKAKLEKKRAEGRGGWEDKNQCSAYFLNQLLNEHVGKGDPVDVGNLAMMLWNRGERTEVVRAQEIAEREPVASSIRGFSLWLDREAWGHVIDGLMLERERSEQRKAANPDSNSNYIANRCAELIAQIGEAATDIVQPVSQEPVAIGSVLQKVMARLCDLLDEDQFANIEAIVNAGGYTAPVEPVNQEPVAWTATRLWNRKDTWTCPADIEKDLLYAVPFRTKELTAQENGNIIYAADHRNPMILVDAAIAADRELNK